MLKRFVKEYFSFTRKERIGITIIFSIIFLFILVAYCYPYFIKQKQFSSKDFEAEIAKLEIEAADSSKNRIYSKNFDNDFGEDYSPPNENEKSDLFYFDPNTTSTADWKRLGVKDKTISTIQKYLSRGGKFKKPGDIAKIWGLHPADVQRLLPYVSIKSKTEVYNSFEKKDYASSPTLYAPKALQPIDVNLADTSALISLPGIGSKLSQRIIAFRDKLGGFYSINQVGETYLLPDSTFQKIKPRLIITSISVKQININTASIDEMKAHPYLRHNLANAIFQYRQQHGNYVSIEEIKKIMLITDDVFKKIAPYLSL